jgi:excisionase family DNA binding protein
MTTWLSVAQAARLGRSTTHVHRLIADGTLPAVRAGTGRGVYRITVQAVDDYLERRAS